ncbi:MAG TPA: CsbD family protein [Anaerolinea sp.]|nr:CsbD family protein [Anaerolinea sp.]
MQEDVLKGKWKQIQGDVKKAWGRLTDDDIQRIEGSREKLAGILQERYGYTRQAVEEKISRFLEEMENGFEMR